MKLLLLRCSSPSHVEPEQNVGLQNLAFFETSRIIVPPIRSFVSAPTSVNVRWRAEYCASTKKSGRSDAGVVK